MCNSYAARFNYRELVEAFADAGRPLLEPGPEAAPNLAPLDMVRPTDPAPVIRALDDGRVGVRLSTAKFGFAPGRPKAGPVINFRSEGREFGRGRCLVPVSAFYEYTGTKYPKTRWAFTKPDEPELFCLAGLFRADAAWGDAFTLLTTSPGPDIAPYHDRAVVVLDRADWPRWLDGEGVEALLAPRPQGTLAATLDSPGRD